MGHSMNSSANKIRQKLANGGVVTMFNPDFQSPRLVAYLAGFDLDVCFLDGERMSYDFERIEEMTRAAHLAGIACMARAWSNDPGLIVRYMDCGLDGMVFPMWKMLSMRGVRWISCVMRSPKTTPIKS